MPILALDHDNGLYYDYSPPQSGRATLVFVNALTGSTATWQAAVAPRCRAAGLGTLCWNFRGQTDSPAAAGLSLDAELITADLTHLVTTLAPPRPVLCGLSIGGLYAARAILDGLAAEGLVLLNTLRRIGPRIDWINAALQRAVELGGIALLLDLYLPLLTGPDYLADHRHRHLGPPAYTPLDPHAGHARLMAGAGSTDWTLAYEALDLPVLTVTGQQDRLFYDADVVAALRARLPNGRHLDWADTGHLLVPERPDRLTEALISFCDGL